MNFISAYRVNTESHDVLLKVNAAASVLKLCN
jgi:hypothetical protein